jgi:hypothetical protein
MSDQPMTNKTNQRGGMRRTILALLLSLTVMGCVSTERTGKVLCWHRYRELKETQAVTFWSCEKCHKLVYARNYE